MATKLKFGLLLPHFCEYGSADSCIEGSKKAEAYGFDRRRSSCSAFQLGVVCA